MTDSSDKKHSPSEVSPKRARCNSLSNSSFETSDQEPSSEGNISKIRQSTKNLTSQEPKPCALSEMCPEELADYNHPSSIDEKRKPNSKTKDKPNQKASSNTTRACESSSNSDPNYSKPSRSSKKYSTGSYSHSSKKTNVYSGSPNSSTKTPGSSEESLRTSSASFDREDSSSNSSQIEPKGSRSHKSPSRIGRNSRAYVEKSRSSYRTNTLKSSKTPSSQASKNRAREEENDHKLSSEQVVADKLAHIRSHERHKEYELTYDMMLGIRTFVSMSNVRQDYNHAELQLDYKEKRSLYFPTRGSAVTPPHLMRSFSFTDYSATAFKELRALFGVNPADYLVDICGDFAYLKFQTNSKSGQFFFYSHDRRYLIKTITKAEKNALRKMIEGYHEHMRLEADSLLTRFVGLHAVNVKGMGKKYFIIMLSVFSGVEVSKASEKIVRETIRVRRAFDLKGSSFGRDASSKEKGKELPVFKDNDARKMGLELRLGVLQDRFKRQLKSDAEFLASYGIIDYSLLLGEGEVIDLGQGPLEAVELPSNEYLSKGGDSDEFGSSEELRSLQDKKVEEEAANTGKSCFESYFGGVRTGNKVYFLGIIDILIDYSPGKKLESLWKGFRYGTDVVSVCKPDLYCKRFVDFVCGLVK